MKNINWGVRFKNKTFWATVIPALCLVISTAANVFGIEIDLSSVQEEIVNLIFAIFALLSAVGVVTDHTTEGFGDSELAMTYEEPKKNIEEKEEE